jgi:Pyruvate/2-oxoacid:ferredoxin oxidoreductase delta subunit
MKSLRKIIRIDSEKCNGCGLCVPSCAEGAIQIVDGKARLVAEKYCDGLGACLGECPEGALHVVDADADAFDELAVKEHIGKAAATSGEKIHGHRMPKMAAHTDKTMPCGCPSTLMQTFAPQTACEKANVPIAHAGSGVSALTHWPVQIHLVPPTAPFLRGADLLVAADCTPVAYPRFHDGLLKGKTLLLGCPKLDDTEEYVKKFSAIFATAAIKSVTVAVMEVPCCQALQVIVRKGMALAGKNIPLSVVTISVRGEML